MRGAVYGLTGFDVEETPMELVKLTVNAATGATEIGPVDTWKVKGTVTVNALPKAVAALPLYQLVNAVPSGTVTSAAARFVPVVGVKWNSALIISRDVE